MTLKIPTSGKAIVSPSEQVNALLGETHALCKAIEELKQSNSNLQQAIASSQPSLAQLENTVKVEESKIEPLKKISQDKLNRVKQLENFLRGIKKEVRKEIRRQGKNSAGAYQMGLANNPRFQREDRDYYEGGFEMFGFEFA